MKPRFRDMSQKSASRPGSAATVVDEHGFARVKPLREHNVEPDLRIPAGEVDEDRRQEPVPEVRGRSESDHPALVI